MYYIRRRTIKRLVAAYLYLRSDSSNEGLSFFDDYRRSFDFGFFVRNPFGLLDIEYPVILQKAILPFFLSGLRVSLLFHARSGVNNACSLRPLSDIPSKTFSLATGQP